MKIITTKTPEETANAGAELAEQLLKSEKNTLSLFMAILGPEKLSLFAGLPVSLLPEAVSKARPIQS